ncbi:hypothetical protein [Paenibacillus sp. RC67]|uniref:hypothetical protein n=1 Tax=Paenibacillus sp. RC67 TaxID=3039392 RepID=UPI0024ADABFB|nr:hypothetical protein [Paenibacillus sp. RC67]
MLKSPFGILIGAAAFVLAVSPEARKAARRLAVKGTEMVLEVSDHIKEAASVRQGGQQVKHSNVEKTSIRLDEQD